MAENDYQRKKDHFRHCAGAPPAEAWRQASEAFAQVCRESGLNSVWRCRMNSAWVVCLYRGGAIDRTIAAKLLDAVDRVRASNEPDGGSEQSVIRALGGDEDLGSVMNYGRTLQEPMSRLFLRHRLLDVFETIHDLMETVLDVADANVDTIMTAHTHFAHAQPITFAHYLLSVFDALNRGAEQTALAYKHVNRNSGGCGSTSGTVWPVDRWLLTRLLGFDDLVEPTYDCEASQDHSMSIAFAMSNIALLLTKVALDIEIWTTEEFDLFKVGPGYLGQSSFMPHKAHPGSRMELVRVQADETLGEMMRATCFVKGEVHGDVLPICRVPGAAADALAHTQLSMRFLKAFLKNITPKKDRMLRIAAEGYSCSTEVVIHMVRDLGFGGRCAHRITATMVRMAREQGIPANRATGALLDAAADFVKERAPRIKTETLRRLLDPVEFIKSHDNIGGTAPEEARRMLTERRDLIKKLRSDQKERKERIEKGDEVLKREIEDILKG